MKSDNYYKSFFAQLIGMVLSEWLHKLAELSHGEMREIVLFQNR